MYRKNSIAYDTDKIHKLCIAFSVCILHISFKKIHSQSICCCKWRGIFCDKLLSFSLCSNISHVLFVCNFRNIPLPFHTDDEFGEKHFFSVIGIIFIYKRLPYAFFRYYDFIHSIRHTVAADNPCTVCIIKAYYMVWNICKGYT